MRSRAAILVVALALLVPATAEAGQSYGGYTVTPANVSNCAPDWTVVQFLGGAGYTVATAGVVTKWFTFGATSNMPNTMRLVMLRGADPNYTNVGQSNVENPGMGQNAFATRIPVQAGDRIAVTSSGGPCLFLSTNSFSVHYCQACNAGPGAPVVANQLLPDYQVNAAIYVEPDGDSDGFGDDSQDNCRGVTNASQANADGDGSGDDCDIDDDNDSVLDGEDAFPLNEGESRDTDGDGVGDNADTDDDNDGVSDADEARAGTDPKNAASRPTAPSSALMPGLSFPPAEGKLKAPVLSAPAATTLAKLRKGVTVSATTGVPALLDFQLRGTPKGVRLARYELLLASRSLGAGSGRRSVRLKPDARRLRGARRFTLQLRVTATDLGGNRAVATRTIKVR